MLNCANQALPRQGFAQLGLSSQNLNTVLFNDGQQFKRHPAWELVSGFY